MVPRIKKYSAMRGFSILKNDEPCGSNKKASKELSEDFQRGFFI
jgi:hypothetical protein